MNATRAAVEEGIVPGGGVAYLRSLPALAKAKVADDEKYGVNIVKRAIEEPTRKIPPFSGKYANMTKAGIIDPTKVSRFALQNAASVASLLLTTEAMVAEKPKKKAAPPMPGGMPPDMGDYDY